tara:strand:+ start:339 stop:473 length:135 start_codon:yes stop_codon:yes gene_type:complete
MATRMKKGDKMTPKGEFFGEIMIVLLSRSEKPNEKLSYGKFAKK